MGASTTLAQRRPMTATPATNTKFYTRTATRWESFKGWLWRLRFHINRRLLQGWEWAD